MPPNPLANLHLGTGRPVAMGWQLPSLDSRIPAFCHPWKIFCNFCCCFIFVVKEKSPEILVELNLGLSDILESSIFSCTHIIHLIVLTYGMKYVLIKCTT